MPPKDAEREPGGWEELRSLDRLLEHRVRLGLCVLLSRHDALSFRRLKELLGETDGSLGAHLRKLEEAGYIDVRKEFRERKPVSWYSLRDRCRRALESHTERLARIIRGTVIAEDSGNAEGDDRPASGG